VGQALGVQDAGEAQERYAGLLERDGQEGEAVVEGKLPVGEDARGVARERGRVGKDARDVRVKSGQGRSGRRERGRRAAADVGRAQSETGSYTQCTSVASGVKWRV